MDLFEPSEYAAHLARTRAAMDIAGLDLLVVSDESNMYYLTGYGGARTTCLNASS